MKLLNEAWKILQEADGPARVVFGKDQMLDPSAVDIKGTTKRAIQKQADEEAAADLSRKKEEFAKKYAGVLDKAKEADDPLQSLFDALVPARGKADTVAGEIVRAMMRILYRDFNDGDKFYEGYGLETAGPSAAYLMSIDALKDQGIEDDFIDIAEEAMKYEPEYDFDTEYTEALKNIEGKVVDFILNHAELLSEPNDVDSRNFSISILDEYVPKYAFDFQIDPEIQEYIDADKINRDDVIYEVESWLENDSVFKGASVDYGWDDTISVDNLSRDGYETLKDWYEADGGIWDMYLDALRSDYGTPDEWEDE